MKKYNDLSIEEVGMSEYMNKFGSYKRDLIKHEVLLKRLEKNFKKEKEILEYKIDNIHENIECAEMLMKTNIEKELEATKSFQFY